MATNEKGLADRQESQTSILLIYPNYPKRVLMSHCSPLLYMLVHVLGNTYTKCTLLRNAYTRSYEEFEGNYKIIDKR